MHGESPGQAGRMIAIGIKAMRFRRRRQAVSRGGWLVLFSRPERRYCWAPPLRGTGTRQAHGFRPFRVIFQRENQLNCLSAARLRYAECFECLAKLRHSGVRLIVMLRRCPIDPVQDRRDLEDLASGFEKVSIQNFRRIAHCSA